MNNSLEENDTYLLWRHYTLSMTDRKVLTRCYLPLIGFQAFSLYLFFDSYLQEENYKMDLIINLKKMININGFELIQAREKLESVGLLKTYKRKGTDKDEYIFYIQQPLDPEHFFKNIMLSKTLRKTIGEDTFLKLKYSFNISKRIDEGYENISAHFEDYYKIDNSELQNEDNNNELMKRENDENDYFNFDEFKKKYQEKEPFSDVNKIDDDVLSLIKNTSELYHLNMEQAVNFYLDSLNNRGVFVEKAFMKKARNITDVILTNNASKDDEYVQYLGDNEISRKIKAFVKFSPAEVMYYLSKTKPQVGDYEIFEQLENEYNLSPSVINVIIDFVLAKSNGMFIKSYVLRTARTIIYNDANKDAYLAYIALNNIFTKARSNNNKTQALNNDIKSDMKKKEKKDKEEKSDTKLDNIDISSDEFAF